MLYSMPIITNEIIQRVINIKHKTSTGTAFAVTKNNIQFLITAKHIFKNINNESELDIDVLTLSGWAKIKAKVNFCSDNIDIAVIELIQPQYLVSTYHNLLSLKNAIYGQDAYFLGFPYNIHMEVTTEINNNLPIPLIKKACFSAFDNNLFPDVILLDGINNKGFSGGPVVFMDYKTGEKNICGVISGYCHENVPITCIKDGNVPQNTGIIYAYNIKYAVEIIMKRIGSSDNLDAFYG